MFAFRAFRRASHRIRLSLSAVTVGAAALGVLATGSPAAATGDYGPDTCLQGYVWRDAFPGDHVCVTGATRSQAASDNSQAAARRSPTGGPYGPDTCLQGYVWREARPGDHVCVSPATRSQAAYDNGQAAARRDSLHLWHATYTKPPVCHGDTCTSTSTDDIPRFRLYGDHVNVAQVTVELRRTSNGHLVKRWRVDARPLSGAPGGGFVLDTGVFDCRRSADSYFQVYDPVSTRWSVRHYVSANCAVL